MISGRLFGEAVVGRYLATDLVDNPIMALEYVKRNQNWDDSNGVALIKHGSGAGSFDSSTLNEVYSFGISRQIFDKNEQYANAIAKSICEEFYLISRQDSDGYECVEYFLQTDETIADSVDVGDIKPGSIGMVEEPETEDIYCMPVVNYHYDNAFGLHRKSLKVLGVDTASEWSAELTQGFESGDGEEVWNLCKAIYDKYKVVNPVPSNISDQKWICDYNGALWKIKKIVEYQQYKRFSFAVPYAIGRTWHPGKQINVTFPNETNNEAIRSVITSITKNKNTDTVSLKIMFLDSIPTEFYSILLQMEDLALVEMQERDDYDTQYQEV